MAVTITRTADQLATTASIASNTATYSGLSTGTASTDRIVVVAISYEVAATVTITGVTIDGVAMTAGAQVQFSTTTGAGIFWTHWPVGTTATFALTLSAAPTTTNHHITIFNVKGANIGLNTAQTDTSSDMDATDPLSIAITVPTSGAALAVASSASDTTAHTWANMTSDLDVDAGTGRHTTGTRTTAGAVTSTLTGSTNQEDGALVVVTFQQTSALPPATMVDGLLSWSRPAQHPISLRTWVMEPQLAEAVVEEFVPARIIDWGMWADPRVAMSWTAMPMPTEPVVAAVPIAQYDWPLTRATVQPIRTWTQAPQPVEIVYIPGQVLDWDIPDRLAIPPQTWIQTPQLVEVVVPPAERPANNAWQLPIAPYRVQQTWAQAPQQAEVVVVPEKPINQSDWPLPTPRARVTPTWVQAPFQGTPIPRNQYSWPLPIPPFRMSQTWTWAQFRGTPIPENQYEWPLPIRPAQPVRSYGVAPQQAEAAPSKPVNQYSWPLPTQPARPAQTWARAPFSGTPLPVSQYNWPLPARSVQPVRSQATAPQPAEAVVVSTKPVVQSDWPLPIRQAKEELTFVESPISAVERRPYNKYDWPLPPQQPRRAITFVRGAIGRSNIPANQYDWTLPLRRIPWSRTWLQSPHPSLAPIAQRPVNQYDWPLPIRQVRSAITWTRSPIFAAPKVFSIMPSRVVDWGTTPAARTMSATTWVQTPMFAAPALPEQPPPGEVHTALPAAHDYPIALRSWTNSGIKVETVFRAPYITPKWKKPYFSYDLPPNMVAALNAPIPPPPKPPLTAVFPPQRGHAYPINLRTIARPPQITVLPPEPLPQNQYNWPIPRAYSRKSDGYSYTFNFYTGRQSPADMPPRTGVFAYPAGPYFPMSLRTVTRYQQNEIPPSEAGTGAPRNLPFIASMGAMTAR